MSFIEGIGDDLLYPFSFLLLIGIVFLAWLSTHVDQIPLPTTLFIIERRSHLRNDAESIQASPTPSSSEPTALQSPPDETLTEHESDVESSESDETIHDQTSMSATPNNSQIVQSYSSDVDSVVQATTIEDEDQSIRITIKFLDDTRKSITANSNDMISKIKRLYFADDLTNNKTVRFIYQGRELQDSETLRRYNIRDQTTIHCQISTQRLSINNQGDNGISTAHVNENELDESSFLDISPISISPSFILVLTLILGSVWCLRIRYRILFTPISTLILILITMIFLIFTCGILLTTRQQTLASRLSTHAQHIRLD